MTTTDPVHRPLAFPENRLIRFGHYLLIAMMLPVLALMAIVGFLFGSYRRALRHAAVARQFAK